MRGAISIKSVKKPMDMETKANDESDMEKTLDSPLLSEDHSIWMGAKPKVYADVRPKILLEVISKRTTTVVLSLTYISFFICFIIDMLNTRIAFTSSNFKFEPLSCIQHSNGPKVTSTISPTIVTQSPTPLMEPTHSEESQACRNDQSYSWNGTVNGLNNVISTQLSVTQTNFSSLSNWSTIDSSNICQFVSVQFDVTLWACYESYGCGNSFSGAGGNNDLHTWHQVIALNSQTATFDSCALSSESSAVLSLLPNTFQNQESIPSNGAVKSYLVQVSFYDNPFQLFIPVNAVAAQSIEYSFEVVQRPTHGAGSSIATAILIVCIVLVLLCSVGYVWIMLETEPDPRLWLPEQQWIVCNLIFVIFYLNPVYCSIFWYSDSSPATASAVYTSYLFDSFGQCGFFAVWLFFADAVSVRSIHATKFYLPKIAFVLSLFICSVVILTLQFPSILPASISARNPVEAVPSWPAELQTVFASFSLTFLVLQWTWAVIWFVYLYLTGSKLSKLPYMSTRYLQLSFRFFNLQAVLLTVYYIAQYSTAAYYIATNDDSEDLPTYSQLADDINTLFREQTQLFGKLVFLTVYTLTLTFLFLPASIALDGESSLADKLADTYVISEAELKTIVRSRRQAIYRLNQMQQSLLENVSSYKPFVFCVDLAISLCNCSLEVYLDPAESGTVVERNAQGEHSQLDLEALGYQMLEFKVDDTHDTVCCIARHNTTRRLLVLFRGTSSRKNWNVNVNLKQSPLDIIDEAPSTPFPSVDDCAMGARACTRDSLFGSRTQQSDGDESKAVVSPLTFLLPRSMTVDSRNKRESEHIREVGSPGRRRNTIFGRSGHDFVEIHDSDHEGGGARDSTATNLLRASMRTVTDTVLGVTSTAVGAVTATATTAEHVMRSAAENAPVLKDILRPRVHSGFNQSFSAVREFVHARIRSELATEPADVLVSGHSLGGALAVICALDISLHTITPMNSLCRSYFPQNYRESHITMYNFGAPCVGNRSFAQLYNKMVPDSFRVVVDGDPVPNVLGIIGYNHIGTEVQIDGVGDSGTIIIGPSFVERRLRLQKGNSVLAHSLYSYRSGLTSIADAANYFSQIVAEDGEQKSPEATFVDIIQATLQARGLVEEKDAETKRIKKAIAKL